MATASLFNVVGFAGSLLVHEATRDFLAIFLQHFADLLALHARLRQDHDMTLEPRPTLA